MTGAALQDAKAGRGVDLEAHETYIRHTVLFIGAAMMSEMMSAVGQALRGKPVVCPDCRQPMRNTGLRTKTIVTLLGPAAYTRTRYRCKRCKTTRFPADEVLGIVNTTRSPGVQRQTARLGAKEPFAQVAKDLWELAGIRLSRKDAERISEGIGGAVAQWEQAQHLHLRLAEPPPPEDTPKDIPTLYVEADGTGVPMVPWELKGRKGKQPDGSAKTREVKLGCVFTQTQFNEQGRPVRDPASTTFTGAIETAHAFGQRLHAEAVRRGLYRARRVIFLGDGAEWIKNLVQTHFPQAQYIIDVFHAKEHISELCRLLFDRDLKRLNQYRERWWELLENGGIDPFIEQARQHLPKNPNACKQARTHIAYFEKNKACMRYAQFRRDGLFIGSGVIEAACKSLIAHRFKQSGMKWTRQGANQIIALCCAQASNRFEEFWENCPPSNARKRKDVA